MFIRYFFFDPSLGTVPSGAEVLAFIESANYGDYISKFMFTVFSMDGV